MLGQITPVATIAYYHIYDTIPVFHVLLLKLPHLMPLPHCLC